MPKITFEISKLSPNFACGWSVDKLGFSVVNMGTNITSVIKSFISVMLAKTMKSLYTIYPPTYNKFVHRVGVNKMAWQLVSSNFIHTFHSTNSNNKLNINNLLIKAFKLNRVYKKERLILCK